MTLMLLSRKLKRDPYTVAHQLFKILFREIKFHKHSTKYLTREEFKALRQYYSTWMKSCVSKFYGHYFAGRIKNAVKFIMDVDTAQPSIEVN